MPRTQPDPDVSERGEPSPPRDASAGDASAFARRHRDRVYWYLRYLRCPHELCEDLTQEALHAGCRHADVVALDDAQADGWLRTTARNLFFMHLRRERRSPQVEDPDVLETFWQQHVQDDARQQALHECLDMLGGRARRALELHYVEGRSRREIGAELGIGPDGVKSLLRRLRESLRRCTERRMR